MIKYTICLCFIVIAFVFAACSKNEPIAQVPDGKKIYIPEELKTMDFTNSSSNWSYKRMATSENIVVFWEPGFGADPSTTSSKAMRFDVNDLLKKSEKIYTYYRDSLKFVDKGSLLDTYRLMVMVKYQTEWLATGAGYDNKVGALWVNPSTMQPVGDVIAHELGHCFQYQVACDGHYGFRDQNYVGSFWEQCAQYMSRQVYPESVQSDIKMFVDNSYRNFSNEEIRYESYFLQEYWKAKHGKDFLGKLWKEANVPEHPLQAYMRINNITQEQLNDEIGEYAMHNIIWDYPQGPYMRSAASRVQAIHKTQFNAAGGVEIYEVAASQAPECYGYNAFRLTLPAVSTQVSVSFKGLAGSFPELSGWRYGFVGVKVDGKSAQYGHLGKTQNGEVAFTVTNDTNELWFVVSGAPKTHWNHVWGTEASKIPKFPYQVKFVNTKPM